jgi:hypothetical protein
MLDDKHNEHSLIGCFRIPGSNPSKQIRVSAGDDVSCSSTGTAKVYELRAVLSRVIDQPTRCRLGLSRKQRFGIAAGLAWAILHLSDSPWLQETLQDEDLCLFLEQGVGKPMQRLSDHPYISYRFQSPSFGTSSVTQAHQQTAVQFQNNQIQNLMLYSLAIRLIELGLNKPFAGIRQEYYGTASSPQTIDVSDPLGDFEVAINQITELYLEAGMSYGNAVDRCLRFLFPGPPQGNTFEHSPFRRMFFDDVVAPIQAAFDVIPSSASQVV